MAGIIQRLAQKEKEVTQLLTEIDLLKSQRIRHGVSNGNVFKSIFSTTVEVG